MPGKNSVLSKQLMEALFFIILLVVIVLILHGKTIPTLSEDHKLSEYGSWYYMEDGAKVPVELPAAITVSDGETLTLYHDSVTENETGYTLVTRGAHYNLSAVAGNEAIYTYEDSEFPRNEQMKRKLFCSMRLPRGCAGETLALTYSGAKNGVYEISEIYIGTSASVLGYYVNNDFVSYCIVFIMAILAVLSLWIHIYLQMKHLPEKRNIHIALFLLLCGIWCVTDSSLLQYVTGNSAIVSYISFYAFMTFPIPLVHFVRNTGNLKKYRLTDAVLFLYYANVLIQSLLNYLGVFDFIDMLFVTHILFVVGIVAAGMLLLREYRIRRSKELLHTFAAFASVTGIGIFALLFYWATGFVHYELIFLTGIVFFIIFLLADLFSGIVSNMHYHAEMLVYQRLSAEDKLTGMKNRRAFDEYLEGLIANHRGNAALIFMDLNLLKETNDRYGHNIGDETLIAAGQCIRSAFGEAGECFRIGGDEFCAVLPDCPQTEKELSDRLNDAIFEHNLAAHPPVSIARGISFLIGPDGKQKSVSDWKMEADLKMYEDKGWQKNDLQH